MLKSVLAACALLCALTVNADARPRRVAAQSPACVETVMRPCNALSPADIKEARRVARGQYIADQLGYGGVADRPVSRRDRRSSASGIVGPLAAKVAEIQSACGSRVISGVRHTRIAGTRRLSLHASGKAVDMAGDPRCIYMHLAGWQGGYSTDYGRVRHVHISYDPDGGREMGIRFRHGSHRYAHRHHRHRYASR